MAELIFWDAWAFVALVDVRYRYHIQAKDIQNMLIRQDAMMITTEAVLTEVGNALSKRALRVLALRQHQFAEQLVSESSGQIVNINHSIWNAAWELYEKRPDKDWGHTDCISFVVMEALGIEKAFTADHHFEQAGFTRLMKI